MDFQLARNLSAITRRDFTSNTTHRFHGDCLNREIIMAAASSEATVGFGQNHPSTGEDYLETQTEKGANRLCDSQIAFITARHERSSSTSVAVCDSYLYTVLF